MRGAEERSDHGGTAVTGRFAAVVAAVMVLAPAAPGWATHAVDHRYVVLGYVRDGAGHPLAGTPIRIVRERTGLSHETETGFDGFYVAIVHLHDEDLLDALDVTAGHVTVRIEARFEPLDHHRPRGTRVDFTPTRAVERHETFAQTLDAYLKR